MGWWGWCSIYRHPSPSRILTCMLLRMVRAFYNWATAASHSALSWWPLFIVDYVLGWYITNRLCTRPALCDHSDHTRPAILVVRRAIKLIRGMLGRNDAESACCRAHDRCCFYAALTCSNWIFQDSACLCESIDTLSVHSVNTLSSWESINAQYSIPAVAHTHCSCFTGLRCLRYQIAVGVTTHSAASSTQPARWPALANTFITHPPPSCHPSGTDVTTISRYKLPTIIDIWISCYDIIRTIEMEWAARNRNGDRLKR